MWPRKDHLNATPGEQTEEKTEKQKTTKKQKSKNHQKHVFFARECILLISNSERACRKIRVCKIWWVFVERMASKHQKRPSTFDFSIFFKVF